MNTETDIHLLDRWLAQHDAHAFREIARRHSRMVFATCKRILRDATEAEDITQECFLTLAQQAARPPESLPAWLHVVAVRRSMNRLRALGRQAARERAFAEAQQSSPAPNLDLVLGAVDEALAELPEMLRLPLVLHFLEQQGQQEIAAQLGVSRSTISRRIDQGIAQLRTRLEQKGLPVSAAALGAALKAQASAVLPAPLATALGKLSLAGNAGGAGAANAPALTLATLAGVILMKKTVVGVSAIVALVLAGLWLLPQEDPAPPPAALSAQLTEQQADVEVDEAAILPAEEPAPAPPPASSAANSIVPAVTIQEGGTISGRVLDAATGEGIPGVKVTARWGTRPDTGTVTAQSDKAGTYRLAGLAGPAGTTYELSRQAPAEYARPTLAERTNVVLDASGHALDVNIMLRQEALLGGTVVDEAGRPVAGAKVALSGGWEMFLQETTESGDDGKFAFRSLPPLDDLHIAANKNRLLASEPHKLTLPKEGKTDLVLVLEPASHIAGVVVNSAGESLSEFVVRAVRVPPTMGENPSTATDANGLFDLTGLSAGRYELVLARSESTSHGSEQKGLPVELGPGQQLLGVTLVYDRQLSIAGRVIDALGNPISEVGIQAASVGSGGGQARSDETGYFEISELEEGDYELNVMATGYQHTTVAGVPAGTPDVAIVLAEPFRVSGRVVDAVSGDVIPEFEIVLTTNWGDWLDGWTAMQFQKVSNQAGRFELTQTQSYRSVLAARAPGYATAMEFLDLTGPPYLHEVELELEHAEDLEGKVIDSQGEPVAGASVYWGRIIAHGDRASAQTAADGSFRLSSPPTQPQLVSAWHPGYAPAAVMTAGGSPSQPLEIVLTEGGSVQGTVTFADGSFLPCQASVAYDEAHFIPDMQVDVTEDGTFKIDRVQPGAVKVNVVVGTDLPWKERIFLSKPAIVQTGATTVVDFTLHPLTGTLEGILSYPDGAVPSRVSLKLNMQVDGLTVGRAVQATPDGGFRFAGVPVGSGELEIDANFQNHRRIATTVRVDVIEDDFAYIEIPL